MTFGNLGVLELGYILVICALPLALLVWFVRTLRSIAGSLREIADRLGAIERRTGEKAAEHVG